jgi:acyl carrier protein
MPTVPERQSVQQLIQNLLRAKGDVRAFSDSDSLFSSGRLASVDALEVVVMLEQEYAIDFSDGFNRDDLDSVDSIVNLIAGSRSTLEYPTGQRAAS